MLLRTRLLALLLLATPAVLHAQSAAPASPTAAPDPSRITLVIHGGAGTITRANMTPEKEQAYNAALNQALQAGYAVLKRGGTSLDAVEASVRVMEDSPLFNAGKGAVFTHEGRNEMDAAIMSGQNMAAGAVAGVTVVRNPITAARAVMEKSEHVMMTGPGAEQFAREKGLVIVEPSYFFTQARYDQLQKALAEDRAAGTPDQLNAPTKAAPAAPTKMKVKTKAGKPTSAVSVPSQNEEASLIFTEGRKYGTVGAVALDQYGNLAAATSTGGMTNKRYGRVGDAPIIGCGTYADNQSCAVSCTGWGEYFIRATVARDVAARVEFQQQPVAQAAQATIDKVAKMGGDGGLIALDRQGNLAMPFNSEGMYRGFIKADGKSQIQIYK
ncbi:isoaspartyl peptidase/L-asparaginase family protein [Hymenobacter puniceus]|uniref:isoaspartyl peptidase/L-asparaginase family protein n=1 Tax=Hymenobacter sp. BT190 TaxID=2763505 RepID=UPI001650F6F0|nr:isoaspartyl peptidase/L-asparaginase [Hymenobacter sp. BT190]MBC6696806.1 isoaspartyl peptidase/L-asparaginase [Hymenobacter sp. BT190]